MDTWADNEKLLEYYTSCGFDYVGVVSMEKTDGLPKHYEGISLSLFEIVLLRIAKVHQRYFVRRDL
jgi:hypothetical protein